MFLSLHDARERALRRAIATGEMPDLSLIHLRQVSEGFQPCFGRATAWCSHGDCRFHRDCMLLTQFAVSAADRALSPAEPAPRLTPDHEWRDGSETAIDAELVPDGQPLPVAIRN